MALPPQGLPRQSWNMFNVLIPYAQFGHTRQSFRAALQAQGVGTGMSYEACHLTTVGRGYVYTMASSPTPNASRAKPSPCRCTRR